MEQHLGTGFHKTSVRLFNAITLTSTLKCCAHFLGGGGESNLGTIFEMIKYNIIYNKQVLNIVTLFCHSNNSLINLYFYKVAIN